MQLFIDFQKMNRIFSEAAEENRHQLFEHETYVLLSALGSESVPRHHLLARNQRLTPELLEQFPGEKVVLKIVSPDIVHKSDTGGVKVVPKAAGKVRSEGRRMVDVVTEQFSRFLETHPDASLPWYQGLSGNDLNDAVNKNIKGVLISEFLPPESDALGHELLVSLRWTREFGMVITAGLGGTDTELYAERFRLGQAVVSASTADLSGESFFSLFKKTIAYRKISGQARSRTRLISDEQLMECFGAFIAVGNYFSPLNDAAPYVIEELEVNPFALKDYEMVPLDGLCRFSSAFSPKGSRRVGQIGHMLHPEDVTLVGVSATKVNFGRAILQNMIQAGFPKKKITIVTLSARQIDGVACVADLSRVRETDLMILAVQSGLLPDLIDDILDHKRAKSVILISGGLGETEATRQRARQVIEKISIAHSREASSPVFLGGNCMGVISKPGHVDSFFTPDACFPQRREKPGAPAALISQSGAFAVVRMAAFMAGDPAYNITVGNQMDLTIGDFITWLADADDVELICVYVEGFQDLDGLHACRGIRKAVQNGKEVLIYKAGRTPEGKKATSGHTASIAGDYMVCNACLSQAGALVADTIEEFHGLISLASYLHDKRISGNRVAAMSPAGFECVGVADALDSRESDLCLAQFSDRTRDTITALFEQSGLKKIMDVKNPLDITPAAPDIIYTESIRAMMQDDGIDAVVVSLGSLSPGTSDTPAPDSASGFITAPESLSSLLPGFMETFDKPLVVFNDAGIAHEPINNWLRAQGVPVFHTSRQAVSLLSKYTAYRERIQRLI